METGSTHHKNGRSWFTAKEAAEYIGVCLDTLYAYCKLRKNRPPFVKLGRDRRFRFPKDRFISWADGSDK